MDVEGGLLGGRRLYVVGVLTLVYAVSIIDRQIVIILQDQLKLEFSLNDKQLGLMTGPAFVVLYLAAGLLIAPLADRHNRRTLVAASVIVWSAATAAAGLAQSYIQLVLARAGVGVGEAGSGPAAYSMIADMYPDGKRGLPTSIFSSGVYLGILTGLAGGGWLGAILGWRRTLVVLGVFGLAVGVLVRLSVAEPTRRSTDQSGAAELPFREVVRTLGAAPGIIHLLIGSSLFSMAGNGAVSFMPPFLLRLHAMDVAHVGLWLGIIIGCGGAIGSAVSGVVADRLCGNVLARYPLLIGFALLLAVPFYVAAFLAPTGAWALGLFVVPALLYPVYLTPSLMVLYRVVPPRARARAVAVLLSTFTGVALGFGPMVVGALSDYFGARMGPEGLRIALIVSVSISSAWALIHFWLAHVAMRRCADSNSAIA
ncbi:putative MFS family arabinose efflux permease [Sphingomonas jinjuensis]|uniref:Putative MFS family arabinose efflux permease n=1 Tax=Sphingomonas jinjuensis TaxID=535907 RepID=A0A840FMC6_9SPHN|nr:MFS transporter [Sphingomonas jinjuensis]MBB4155078.1 putative MFS family arabinose efflux permease [Sphingomonas jinjuensis]